MKLNLKTPTARKTGITLLFYLIVTILIILLNRTDPGGSCNPSSGIMIFMLLPFVSTVLALFNINSIEKGKNEYRVSKIIHLSVVAVYVILFLLLYFNVFDNFFKE